MATHPRAAEIAALAAAGKSDIEIGRALGLHRDAVRRARKKSGVGPGVSGGGQFAPPVDPVAEWQARRDAAERSVQRTQEHLADVFDWLRPVQMPAPERGKARVRPNLRRRLVISDAHFPLHCKRTIDLFLQAVELLRPWQVILGGDMCDLFAVSKYPNDARSRFTHTLRDEVVAYHEFLHRLVTIGAEWGLKIVQVNANHDGDGIESRWWRYISSNAPALVQHPKAESLLSFKSWFVPEWADIEFVDEILVGDVLVTHGTIVRGKGGYSARAHMERYHHSVLHGHTHRQGMSVQRVPAVGNRPEAVQKSYEIGCACDLNPSYAQRPDWANGFAVLTEDETGQWAQVELIPVHDGRATVSALDATLVAA